MTIEHYNGFDVEGLRKSIFRIGIQKDGVLTNMSVSHIEWAFEQNCPKYRKENKTLSFCFSTSEGVASIHYLRNTDLGPMVANGLLDAAIMGTDMIEENDLDDRITKMRVLSDGTWPLRYMTLQDRPVEIGRARIIGSSYLRVSVHVLGEVGNSLAQVWKVAGSTELLPLLSFGGIQIDGVLDINVTGKTACANGLLCFGEPYRVFRPVLVANSLALTEERKTSFYRKL